MDNFKYLGSVLRKDGLCTRWIKIRVTMAMDLVSPSCSRSSWKSSVPWIPYCGDVCPSVVIQPCCLPCPSYYVYSITHSVPFCHTVCLHTVILLWLSNNSVGVEMYHLCSFGLFTPFIRTPLYFFGKIFPFLLLLLFYYFI